MLKQFLRRNNASCAFNDVRRVARRRKTASLELKTVDSCFIADWSTEQYGLAARNVPDDHACDHADVVIDDLAFTLVEYKAD